MKIFSKVKRIVSRHKLTSAVVTAGLLLAVPMAVRAAWGPSRPVYDYSKAPLNGSSCTAADAQAYDRCGSMNGPVFNSFINTPSYGDERDFVQVAPNGSTSYSNNASVKAGDTVSVRVYIHNNANSGTNDSGVGIAHNANVRVYLPSGTANGFDVAGYVGASNATPARVYDTGRISDAAQAVGLSYVPGSAKIYNDGPMKNGVSLPDSVVTTGAPIGYSALNGDLPGCFNYRAVVILQVKVTAPALQFSKQVTTPGSTNWSKAVSVKHGDTVSWLLSYKNTGNGEADNITLRDQLPAGLKLVPGSITWFDQYHPNGEVEKDTVLNAGGLNVGDALPNGGGYIRFRTVVDNDKAVCSLTNVAYAHSDQTSDQQDTAKVNITDCQPTVPVYTCDALAVTKTGDKTYSFTVNYTAKNGATFKNVTFDFGDGHTLLTNQTTYAHTYTAAGSYTAKALVTFTVDRKDVTVPAGNCVTPVAVGQENCTVPGKENLPVDSPECAPGTPPTTLVNTGPGSLVGIFAATTLAGAVAYNVFASRRYGQR